MTPAPLPPLPNSQPPAPTDKTAPIPAARDVPFPGTLQLTVDATDVTRGIFRIRERVPVTAAGDLVLLYPKWIPGGHTPRGDIAKVAGFKFSANGQPLEWKRDTIDVAAFHVNVPAGVTVVDVEFQYLTPTAANQGRIVATPDLASIQWISNSLYPAGYYVRQIPVQASVIVPTGCQLPAPESENSIRHVRPNGPERINSRGFSRRTSMFRTGSDCNIIW